MTVFADGGIAESVLTAILIPIFYHSFMLPVMFKFGTEKSRIIVMVAVVLPALVVGFAEEAGWLDNFIMGLSGMSEVTLIAAIIGVVLVMYIASIFASLAICKNKEW